MLAIKNKSDQQNYTYIYIYIYIYIYPKQMEINEIIVDEFIHISSNVFLKFLNTWWFLSNMIDHL